MENCLILCDPVFSDRCSPSQMLGPIRFRPVPIAIEQIPKLDAVIISHNHYDHLDYNSVISLDKKFGKNAANTLNWFVGLNTKSWFESCGIKENVHELNWSVLMIFSNDDFIYIILLNLRWESKTFKNIDFVFTPAQHWCSRSFMDRNECLWGSWSLIGQKKKLFFAGDTGYCPAFKEIGKKFSGFDVSLIPIGAYEPR